jgi:hypothetical protein
MEAAKPIATSQHSSVFFIAGLVLVAMIGAYFSLSGAGHSASKDVAGRTASH